MHQFFLDERMIFMLYYTIAALAAVLLITGIYALFNKNKKDEDNIMNDVPTINANKEELQKHAVEISNYSSVIKKSNYRKRLIKSLDISYKKILKGYDYIDKEVKNNREVIQAAEWLLDNLYLIQREYSDIKVNMPEAY